MSDVKDLQRNVQMVIDDCCVCGVVHAIPQVMWNNFRNKGGFWYCPNGHHIGWDTKDSQSENDKLRGKVAELEGRVEREKMRTESARQEKAEAERKAAAARGQVTKIKKRVGNGVCPCCNRSFTNVRRHMSTKHPDYAEAV